MSETILIPNIFGNQILNFYKMASILSKPIQNTYFRPFEYIQDKFGIGILTVLTIDVFFSAGRLGSLLQKLMVKLIQLSRYQGGRFLLSASAAVKLSANDVEVTNLFSLFSTIFV